MRYEYLLFTSSEDVTCDFIVKELRSRGKPVFRLNTDKIATSTFLYSPDPEQMSLEIGDRRILLSDVRAAYYRRPKEPQVSQIGPYAEYYTREWRTVLQSVICSVDAKWLNHPREISRAEDKLQQLRVAKNIGFRIPSTVVTNDPKIVRARVQQGDVVVKPIRRALFENNGYQSVTFTTQVSHIGEGMEESIRACPFIVQELIKKRFDVRVTVVGNSVFAVAIHSQDHSETQVDWRRGGHSDLPHEAIELPVEISSLCREMVRRQSLRFGAIDLVLDRDGEYWFLECNPNGQWAWIENRTGLPIAKAIVDEMEEIANA